MNPEDKQQIKTLAKEAASKVYWAKSYNHSELENFFQDFIEEVINLSVKQMFARLPDKEKGVY